MSEEVTATGADLSEFAGLPTTKAAIPQPEVKAKPKRKAASIGLPEVGTPAVERKEEQPVDTGKFQLDHSNAKEVSEHQGTTIVRW